MNKQHDFIHVNRGKLFRYITSLTGQRLTEHPKFPDFLPRLWSIRASIVDQLWWEQWAPFGCQFPESLWEWTDRVGECGLNGAQRRSVEPVIFLSSFKLMPRFYLVFLDCPVCSSVRLTVRGRFICCYDLLLKSPCFVEMCDFFFFNSNFDNNVLFCSSLGCRDMGRMLQVLLGFQFAVNKSW